MDKLRRRLRKLRDTLLNRRIPLQFHSKTLVAILIMAVLSFVAAVVFLRVTTDAMEDNVKISLQQSVEQRKRNIDFRLYSVQQLSENLMGVIYPYINSNAPTSSQYTEFSKINSIISVYTRNSYIGSVRLYLPEEKTYSHQGITFRSLERLKAQPDAIELPYLQNSGLQWLETQELSVLDGQGQTQQLDVLTCAFSLRQITDYSQIGCVLMLDMDVHSFEEVLNSELDNDAIGYLVNGQGKCLVSRDTESLHTQLLDPEVAAQLKEADCIELDDSVYVYHRLDYNGWYVVVQYPQRVLSAYHSQQADFLWTMLIAVSVLTLTIVSILVYNYSVHVTLMQINSTMAALHRGEEPEQHKTFSILDPLQHLKYNTDQMVRAVDEMAENRYKDQVAIIDSQMKSLQAQIKPHFLYNSLDIICWMIRDGRIDDAVWMVGALSKYLRQSINRGPAIIPVSEELEICRSYLQIMQKRFDNRFNVCYEVEQDVEDFLIPKLTLQPMLENALLHGVLYSEKEEKTLWIRVWLNEDNLQLEIEDNGNGMSPEQQESLRKGEGGYGFCNVYKRLQLFSKGACNCTIHSKESVGTCITLEFPAVTENNTL